jgi:hypothetical protein
MQGTKKMNLRRNAVYIMMALIIVAMIAVSLIDGDGQKALHWGVLLLAIFGMAKKDHKIEAQRSWLQVQMERIEQQDQVLRELDQLTKVESAGGRS